MAAMRMIMRRLARRTATATRGLRVWQLLTPCGRPASIRKAVPMSVRRRPRTHRRRSASQGRDFGCVLGHDARHRFELRTCRSDRRARLGKTAFADVIARGCDAIPEKLGDASFLGRASDLLGSATVKLDWQDGEQAERRLDGLIYGQPRNIRARAISRSNSSKTFVRRMASQMS